MPLGYAKVEASELERPFHVHPWGRLMLPLAGGVSTIPTGLGPVREGYPLSTIPSGLSLRQYPPQSPSHPCFLHRVGTAQVPRDHIP